ncbi:MAG: thioredoxin [Paludibacteraceae bacterium]|jgi:thioredoxin 1|nr:thioredoxin [Paludibacteraceae bacterium]MBQ6731628.1 thioredoxin [Paludibacteraceae bacterium]MBQ6765729.1 thioredoxin [Paludibacteraceae bacterium]MDY6372983.1 thioredoxin [Bacteroidales bacterium]MDY6427638.1 thioredoxin [Bacteroidales bacterium]
MIFTEENFKDVLANNTVVVADFWATWCGPCRMVGPVIESLANDYEGKAAIGKIDIEENDSLTEEYGIRNVPTVLFFKNGQLVDKVVGAGPRAMYEDKLKALL